MPVSQNSPAACHQMWVSQNSFTVFITELIRCICNRPYKTRVAQNTTCMSHRMCQLCMSQNSLLVYYKYHQLHESQNSLTVSQISPVSHDTDPIRWKCQGIHRLYDTELITCTHHWHSPVAGVPELTNCVTDLTSFTRYRPHQMLSAKEFNSCMIQNSSPVPITDTHQLHVVLYVLSHSCPPAEHSLRSWNKTITWVISRPEISIFPRIMSFKA